MKMDAALALKRALRTDIGPFDGLVEVEMLHRRDWASITFTGERHRVRLRLEGDGAAASADAFLDGLGDREFDLPGHFVADIVLMREDREDSGVTLVIEALTVELD